MTKRSRLIFALPVVVLIGAMLAVFINRNAPAVSDVTIEAVESAQVNCLRDADANCLRLPEITGDNLAGATATFPAALTGDLNLVVMPFEDAQQAAVLDYVPLFQELAATHDNLAYYSLAPLPDLAPAIRLLVTGGTSVAVSDEALRELTYIMFLEDQNAFLAALDMTERDTEAIQVFLFTREGEALWRGTGTYDETLDAAIRAAITDANA